MSYARDRVRDAGGAELLERLDHLDAHRAWRTRVASGPASQPPRPDRGARLDVDVVLAGGGLSLLLAPLLADRGLRVAVLDRARAGQAHREWNASGPELTPLVESGLFTPADLERAVVARYRYGVCRFGAGEPHPVSGVLDHAVDAGALLTHARDAAERRGVLLCDGHEVVGHASGEQAVTVRARARDGAARDLVARVMVDARGASSPYATADLVCPTVGGVIRGLAEGAGPTEIDPQVGEILATNEPITAGRQHVWEAFPGRPGETAVYLFYYARAAEPASLAELYARFFDALPRYKRGDARLVRPTFGFIPGWSRLSPPPAPPDRRVLLVGDAAARHSPLTFCGFGAALRSLIPSADAIARAALDGEHAESIVHDCPVHALTGALAHLMASRSLRGDELNTLLDAAFRSLRELGDPHYARLLRDEMAPPEFVAFLRRTAARHPAVWRKVMRGLDGRVAAQAALRIARAMLAA